MSFIFSSPKKQQSQQEPVQSAAPTTPASAVTQPGIGDNDVNAFFKRKRRSAGTVLTDRETVLGATQGKTLLGA